MNFGCFCSENFARPGSDSALNWDLDMVCFNWLAKGYTASTWEDGIDLRFNMNDSLILSFVELRGSHGDHITHGMVSH